MSRLVRLRQAPSGVQIHGFYADHADQLPDLPAHTESQTKLAELSIAKENVLECLMKDPFRGSQTNRSYAHPTDPLHPRNP